MTNKKQTTTEELRGHGEDLLDKLKVIIKEGNVRKIIVKDKRGKSIAEFPLSVGVIGTAFLPALAAVGAVIALVAECSISVEREK